MAYKVTAAAIEVTQPGLGKTKRIFNTALKVGDLINSTMFKVDFWKKELASSKDQGYQRFINDRHAQKISNYVSEPEAILPTAVIISTRDKKLHLSGGTVTINDYPLFIVDGQHRLAGLRNAIENEGQEQWKEALIPATILEGFSKFEEMEQFVSLNTNQKKVETDLALQLIYDLARGNKKWSDKFVGEGSDWKVRAIKLVNEINSRANSPWHGSIKIAGEKRTDKHLTSSNSFTTSLKPLVSKGVFDYNRDINTNVTIIVNFWDGVRAELMDAFLEPKNYAIQKTPGLFTLHTLLQSILAKKGHQFGLHKQKLQELTGEVLREAEAEVDFWRSDNPSGVTTYGSMKGFRILSERFIEALDVVDK